MIALFPEPTIAASSQQHGEIKNMIDANQVPKIVSVNLKKDNLERVDLNAQGIRLTEQQI